MRAGFRPPLPARIPERESPLTPRRKFVYCIQFDVLPGVRRDLPPRPPPSSAHPRHTISLHAHPFPHHVNQGEIPAETRRDMFNKVLVPLDGSARAERAIDLVEKMAKGSVAEVLLLKVVPAPLG